MAVAVDASSPARVSATGTGTNVAATTGSFTPPLDSFLVVFGELDTNSGEGAHTVTATNTGGAVTWRNSGAPEVVRNTNEVTSGGYCGIFLGRVTTSASMTVTLTRSEATGTANGRISVKVYVCTGVDVDGTPVDTIGAGNEGGSGTNNLTTTSVTPGATGMLFAGSCDWNALGAFQASSDLTQDTAHYAGEISVCDGYKTASSGVGVTANLNAGGAGTAQHKWTQVIIREAAAGASVAEMLTLLGVG